MDKTLMDKFKEGLGVVFGVAPQALTRETNIKQAFNISSTMRFMIIANIEEIFGASVDYFKIQSCVTIGDLYDLVEHLPAGK